jgi:hypothetical protein
MVSVMTRFAQNVLAGEPGGNDPRERSMVDTVGTPDRAREGPLFHLKQFSAGALVENG